MVDLPGATLHGVATIVEVMGWDNTLETRFRGVVNTVEMLGGFTTLVGGVPTMAEHVEDPDRITILVTLEGGVVSLVAPVGDITAMVEG